MPRSSTSEHPITVNAFNPGPAPGTRLARDASAFERFGWNVLLPLMRPLFPNMSRPEAAAQALAHLVLDSALEQITGKYFEGMNERASSQESYDQRKASEKRPADGNLLICCSLEIGWQVCKTGERQESSVAWR